MHLTYPNGSTSAYPNGFAIGSFSIAFYALFILGGALVALLLSSYRARKQGFSFDFFITIFLIAFPLGIVGARIWYVIAEFDSFLDKSANFGELLWNIINIKEGGLAIQGGAILGILSGVIYVRYRRKGVPILQVADFAVPTILIAQAIGRWGNFFNQEVYGNAVNSEAWSFLAPFIFNNMSGGSISKGFVAPLFLIEGLLNVGGYFFIVYFVKFAFDKFYKDGDQTFMYLVVYGFIRMIMEPMRDSSYIMGNSDQRMKSFWMAFAFIVVGITCIILNHVFRYLDKKGKFKNNKFIDWCLNRKAVVSSQTVDSNKPVQVENESKNEKAEDDNSDEIVVSKDKLDALKGKTKSDEKKD